MTADPRRGRATFNGDHASGLTWEFDGGAWSPTGLAKHIVEQAIGRRPDVIGGPRWWVTDQGKTLRELADSVTARAAFDWSPLHQLLERLPAGTWTSYGDLAHVLGTAAQPVANHIAGCVTCERGYRVLAADGTVAENFRWLEPGRDDDPVEALVADGVEMTSGKASPLQRLDASKLQEILCSA